jgi:hypothetical protein
MHLAANLLPSASSASTACHSPNSAPHPSLPEVNESFLEKLFRALQAEFGTRWSSQLRTPEAMADLKIEWWAKVHDLTPAQVRLAINSMAVGQDAWPPGPRAFRKLALADQEATQRHGMHALYLPSPPAHPVSRERVLADLAGLKDKLPAAPEAPVAAPPISLAERRAYIARHRADLVAAGLAGYVAEAELPGARVA